MEQSQFFRKEKDYKYDNLDGEDYKYENTKYLKVCYPQLRFSKNVYTLNGLLMHNGLLT